GFVRTYIFSTDHKMIARQFLFLGLFMMILGGLLALVVRWQLAWPETAVPGLGGILSETGGILEPAQYNMAFTMHATIMIFFVIMPILAGSFGNFCIPLMIGARDMAFPFLNMLSFWVTAAAGVIMLAGFFVEGGHAAAGWTSYAPLSAVTQYTGVNWGQNIWCISLFTMGLGSMMGSINYITTIINMRAPGMTLFRMPLFVWMTLVNSFLIIFALAIFVGYHVVWNVTPALHTPLMAVTNAISSVILVGAILAAGTSVLDLGSVMGVIAVALASVNVAGGFLVTQRMLEMFKKKSKAGKE
ncbi:MAG: proton-translocating transhydrogenase family protein, partial [Pseudomonadota bacterium]